MANLKKTAIDSANKMEKTEQVAMNNVNPEDMGKQESIGQRNESVTNITGQQTSKQEDNTVDFEPDPYTQSLLTLRKVNKISYTYDPVQQYKTIKKWGELKARLEFSPYISKQGEARVAVKIEFDKVNPKKYLPFQKETILLISKFLTTGELPEIVEFSDEVTSEEDIIKWFKDLVSLHVKMRYSFYAQKNKTYLTFPSPHGSLIFCFEETPRIKELISKMFSFN